MGLQCVAAAAIKKLITKFRKLLGFRMFYKGIKYLKCVWELTHTKGGRTKV